MSVAVGQLLSLVVVIVVFVVVLFQHLLVLVHHLFKSLVPIQWKFLGVSEPDTDYINT